MIFFTDDEREILQAALMHYISELRKGAARAARVGDRDDVNDLDLEIKKASNLLAKIGD